MMLSAMATVKSFHRPVSMTVAVCKHPRITHYITAPMMDVTKPRKCSAKPAMTAASRGSRASLMRSQSICMRVAPRARIWRRRLAGRFCMAAR